MFTVESITPGTIAFPAGNFTSRQIFHSCSCRPLAEGNDTAIGLAEILASEGITVHPFSYPLSRRPEDLARELARFAERMGTTVAAAEAEKERLDDVRRRASLVDELAVEGRVKSGDLFAALLATTDFLGDPEACAKLLDATLARIHADDSPPPPLRLSWAGVPAIWPDVWDRAEAWGARVVDHEVPRQFALLDSIGRDLVATYLAFTYPYDTASRIRDVAREAERRGAAGVVHYVQSFCHRAIGDRLWREGIRLPVLTLEADRPGLMDERTRTRFEAFLERSHPAVS